MIKRLCKLNKWLPLVKDLVPHWAPYHWRGAKIFLVRCQVSRKNVSHLKVKVRRTGVSCSVIFFLKMAKQTKGKEEEECLHPWVKVDQAVRPLPPKSLNILVGLTLKLDSLCIIVSVVENIWTVWLFLDYLCC